MSLTADQIVDRRRLRRKLSFWRVVAFVAVALALIAAIAAVSGRDVIPGLMGPQIARVNISGFITDDRDQLEMLDKIASTDAVKGVIVAINSTGGATAGGESLYGALRRLAAKKPVVATMSTVGASAAYMAAIATDHIVALRSTITGSIGVIFEYPEISGLLDHLGINVEEIKSAPLKAAPSPFKPTSPEARAVIDSLVRDTYNWFVDIVAKRRGLSHDQALTLADGRVFTGQQALAAKLIDEIGGENAALDWLASKGVNRDLPVKDWRPANRGGGLLSADALTIWVARELGLSPQGVRDSIVNRLIPAQLKLDGLMSVWQGPMAVGDPLAGGSD